MYIVYVIYYNMLYFHIAKCDLSGRSRLSVAFEAVVSAALRRFAGDVSLLESSLDLPVARGLQTWWVPDLEGRGHEVPMRTLHFYPYISLLSVPLNLIHHFILMITILAEWP